MPTTKTCDSSPDCAGAASKRARTNCSAVDVQSTAHSLLLPMVMLCTHKHALGACTSHTIDASKFIADHVELVLTGLLQAPAKPPRKARTIKSV